jgi:hypothetical protein
LNTPFHLRGEFLKALSPERTRSTLRHTLEWRRNGQVESSVKSDGLIHDPEISIEVLELTAQRSEAACHQGGIADVVIRAKKMIERGFDERRFCGTGPLGRGRQPSGHLLGEINANSGFHG